MKKKIIVSSILFALLILLFAGTVFAAPTGTVQFKAIDSDGYEVDNLEVAFYKVADFEVGKFTATEEFKIFDIEDISNENIVSMQEYASENASVLLKRTTNEKGEFTLSEIEAGKYLLVQNSREDYCTMQTMFISVPEITTDTINYTITAKPKIAVIDAIGGAEEDILEPTPVVPESKPNAEPELPNTGVLNWPIPVLAIAGIILFCLSWIIFYSKKKVK